MVNKKRALFLGTFLLFAVLFLALVSSTLAGVSLVSPAAGASISGTYTFNAAITGTNSTNVTFYWWNSTGSSWKLLCYNATTGTGPFTCSYDTTGLPDSTTNTFNVTAVNSTVTTTDNNTGVTIDNTVPVISIKSPASGWKRQNITIYANSTDATTNVTNSTIYFWFGNSTGNFSRTLFSNCNYANSATGFNCSATFNSTNLADGNYTLWINASDTLGNVKNQSKALIGVDNSAPNGIFSCSPYDLITTGNTITCTCAVSDYLSGVDSSQTSYTAHPSTANLGTYNPLCTFVDNAGNTGSASANYSVLYVPSLSNSGSGSSSAASQISHQNLFSTIVAGTPSFASGFSSDIGVKQIEINVNNKVTNVQVTVTGYSSKPSEVSVAKSGKVFQYFRIATQNLGANLSVAVIEIRVNKTWITDNNLNYNNMTLYKFDNSSEVWNDLNATYSSQDSSYYYYNATVTSFSYFVIAEKGIVENVAQSSAGTSNETSTATPISVNVNSVWFWIILSIVAIAIVVVAVLLFFKIRKKNSSIIAK